MIAPILHIMVGIPGAGKSTFVNNNKQNGDVVVSSDAIRKELFGDENCQDQHDLVFLTAQQRTVEALCNGKSVWYDATNVSRKNRSSIIGVCPKFVKIVAEVVWASIEDCIERDAKRNRTVGKDVIMRMAKRFECPYYDEGIDEVRMHIDDNWDSLEYFRDSLNGANISHDNPHHTLSIRDHCLFAYKKARELKGENVGVVIQASIAHDLGKPLCKTFTNAKGEPTEIAHYYGHQGVSAWMAIGYRDPSLVLILFG